jgi:hypothetical protein
VQTAQEETVKFKFAIVALAALGSLTAAKTATAMPLATFSNFER